MRTGPLLRAVVPRLLVLGLLVVLAVLLRAGDPRAADDTGWRLDDLLDRGRRPLVVVGIIWLLVVLVVVVLSVRNRDDRPISARRRSSLLASFAVLSAFVVLAWLLQLARDARRPEEQALPLVTPAPVRASASPGDAVAQGEPGLVLLVALVLVVLVAIAVVSRRTPPAPALPDDEAPALADGLEAAARVLRSSVVEEPRERVLSAYEAFELALAGRGVQRGRSGTPTALLARAVAAGAPQAPAAELTRLFGAARFGIELVTEDDVCSAERAVNELMVRR